MSGHGRDGCFDGGKINIGLYGCGVHLYSFVLGLSLHIRAGSSNQVEALEAEARSFAAGVGVTGLLTMATGLTTMDAWVTVAEEGERPKSQNLENVTIGVGTPATGLAGFIQSHREAKGALGILHLAAPGRLDPIAYYDEVRLLSLMAKDIPGARGFVFSTLTGLAGTDERTRELRETLLAFFQANKSCTAVAVSSHLHKKHSRSARDRGKRVSRAGYD